MIKHYLFAIAVCVCIICCKKDTSCENCIGENRSPIADAGIDQVITLPLNFVDLDGSKSSDPDNNFANYYWTKLSGPDLFTITNVPEAITRVTNLVQGTYVFELRLTDAGNNKDYDTITLQVDIAIQSLSANVFFYCPDPTGTIPGTWITWDEGNNNPITLVNIKIHNMTGALSGVWCKTGCAPRCPINNDFGELGNFRGFKLPPGTYTWSAEHVTDLSDFLQTTSEFINFFSIPHKAEGIITVRPNSGCEVVPIIF